MRVCVLHPGAMGASVCAALATGGAEVRWVKDGRGAATIERAAAYPSIETMRDLPDEADAVISVCPPDAAEAVSEAVKGSGFSGLFVDANAISPERAQGIAQQWGNQFVDGGIVGLPAWKPGTTRLYLSGEAAGQVAAWFAGTPLEAVPLGAEVGAASALKMCYAAYTKGSSALLLGIRALAEELGVASALEAEWGISQPGLQARLEGTARSVAPKAWRFEGEMREIAATFQSADLPSGFHAAAAELYAGLAALKDREDVDVAQVLAALRGGTRK